MIFASAAVQDPLSASALGAFGALLAALGLSSTAGLRAYLPLLAVALAGNANLVPLQTGFQDLGSAPVLIILALLVIGEFVVDKVPIVDHISDAVHTIIRPVSGAVIMAGTANTISDKNGWIAAIIGAVLALLFHGVKATTRPAVSATTAGIGNPIVSLIEDVLVVASVVLLAFAPVIGFVLLVLLVLFIGRLIRKALRRFRGRGGKSGKNGNGKRGRNGGNGGVPVASMPASAAVPPPASVPPASMPPSTGAAPPPMMPTLEATQQAVYPAGAGTPPSPVLPPPQTLVPPATTQAYPPVWPAQPQQQPGTPYPGDAPTLPGSN